RIEGVMSIPSVSSRVPRTTRAKAPITTKLTVRAWSAPRSSYGSNAEGARLAMIFPSASRPGRFRPEFPDQPLDALARCRQQRLAEFVVAASVDRPQRQG